MAPSPPIAGPTPRYVFLIGRLRRREITMEEATELFALQQAMLRAAQSALPPPPPPPGGSSPALGATYPPTPSGVGGVSITEDSLWTGLLFFGAGAGVLAAVLRRSAQERGGTAKPSR
ncbi:MAG TPA: hypothetical protein VFF67_03245 [Thermoplasmata archaeon]|nr:hypothetical protein [Thermoplasmata archaeon]